MSRVFIAKAIVSGVLSLLVITSLPVCVSGADLVEENPQTDFGVPISLEATEAAALEEVELPVAETVVETHKSLTATAGYRFIGIDGHGERAAEYEDLHSGAEIGFHNSISGRDHKYLLDGAFISDNDFFANLTYDYMGAFRVQLRTDSLYHNLDRLTLFTPDFTLGGSPYSAARRDDGRRYGIRAEQDLAALRTRLGSYPIHLNMQYWRMFKEGNAQLRFADQAFSPAGTPNTIYSVNRRINRETHEGKLGLDAHIGPLDLIYDLTLRRYSDNAGTPSDPFAGRMAAGSYQRSSGSYEHNDTPESSYISHTVRMHTEQTGGFVAAAAYSVAQRENRGSLDQVSGAKGLKDTLQTAAGDIVYTPAKEISLALRFRHQEIDRDSATVTAAGFTQSTISANKGIDIQKDVISAVLSYKPIAAVTVKGEYRGEFTSRDNTDSWDPYGNLSGIALPSSTELHKGVLTILGKPYRNLRLKAKYSYTAVNNPEYGASFDKRHEGQFQAIYSIKDRFGFSTNYQVSQDYNDSSDIRRLGSNLTPPNYDPVPVSRERRNDSATASVWGTLLEGRLSLTGTAGFLHSKVDQQALFAATSSQFTATATNYTSQALLYGITAAFRPIEKLDTSISFQQIRSYSEFDPVSTNSVNAAGIEQISDLRTVENSLSFKAAYQLYRNISCGLDYRYREYSDDRNRMFDGTVHSIVTSLTAKW